MNHGQNSEVVTTDVLIVGGGTSGVIAAIAAAEEGARVMLIERDTRTGGVGVRGGIHFYYIGTKGGLQDRIDKATRAMQRSLGVKRARSFHPEAKWLAVDSELKRLGVDVRYSSVAREVLVDGQRVVGAVIETERSRLEVLARVTIDATGDGDVSALAGAAFTLGREWDGAQHTYSLTPRGYADGEFDYSNYDVGWVDATSVVDVSRAYRTGRKYVWRDGETPADTNWIAVGPQLGVREGRLIQGDYTLEQDDLLLDRFHEDTVMRCLSHHDSHTHDYGNESDESQTFIPILGLRMFKFGGRVPYRSFLPAGIDGLLIGCRAISQTHDCSMGLRMQRDMQKVGEVAGVAAALAIHDDVDPRKLSIKRLQSKLVERGVLDGADLERPPVPWLTIEGIEGVPTVEDCVHRLGTDEEPRAIWWLQHLGSHAVPSLRRELDSNDHRTRRGAALTLGLLGDRSGVNELLHVIDRMDDDRPGSDLGRAEPRWIAAFIVLRMLADPSAVSRAVSILKNEGRSTTIVFLLRYLAEAAPLLNGPDRRDVADAVRALLRRDELGSDFLVQGSGGVRGTRSEASSLRWNLELLAAYVLERLGHEAEEVFEKYRDDPRGYARNYVERLSHRLERKKVAS